MHQNAVLRYLNPTGSCNLCRFTLDLFSIIHRRHNGDGVMINFQKFEVAYQIIIIQSKHWMFNQGGRGVGDVRGARGRARRVIKAQVDR